MHVSRKGSPRTWKLFPVAARAARRKLRKGKSASNFQKMNECTGKTSRTEEDAKQRAKDLLQFSGAQVDAYPCDFCPYWHVGHIHQRR